MKCRYSNGDSALLFSNFTPKNGDDYSNGTKWFCYLSEREARILMDKKLPFVYISHTITSEFMYGTYM